MSEVLLVVIKTRGRRPPKQSKTACQSLETDEWNASKTVKNSECR